MKKNVYRDFWLGTLKYESPQRFGFDWFTEALNHLWEYMEANSTATVNWLDFEAFSRDCLASHLLTDKQKVWIVAEAIGAFTGRGSVEFSKKGK